jgi:hypothetical protein
MPPSTPIRALLTLASAGLLFSASDNWKTKEFHDWTATEAQRILDNSPWSAKVFTDMSGGARKPGDLIPGGGHGSWGGGSGGAGPAGGGGGGYGGYGGPHQNTGDEVRSHNVEVTVRWESALPVLQARARLTSGDAAKIEEAKDYTVAVVWPNTPGASTWSGGGGGGGGQSNPKDSARLVFKNRDAITAEDTQVKSDDSGREMLFLFPKTTPITLDDKEVTFVTQIGRMKIEHKFKLKDMVFRDQLAL